MNQLHSVIMSTVMLLAMVIHPAKAQQVRLTLAPHGAQLIENHYVFSLDATCTIQTNEKHPTIKLHVLEKTGTVNGKHLSKGQSTSVVVHNRGAISVHAEPGSKVNVLNLSDNLVHANCSV